MSECEIFKVGDKVKIATYKNAILKASLECQNTNDERTLKILEDAIDNTHRDYNNYAEMYGMADFEKIYTIKKAYTDSAFMTSLMCEYVLEPHDFIYNSYGFCLEKVSGYSVELI